jgi:hypothetical protein
MRLSHKARKPLSHGARFGKLTNLGGSVPQTARRPWEFGERPERPEPQPLRCRFSGAPESRRGPVSNGNNVLRSYA